MTPYQMYLHLFKIEGDVCALICLLNLTCCNVILG